MSQERATAGTLRFTDRLAPGWIVLFVAITCLAVLLSSLYAMRLPREQYDKALWVGHTRDVMEQLARLALHVAESETDQRGYLLTGDANSLTSYDTAVRRTLDNLSQLETLVSDNEIQNDRLSRLRQLIEAYQASLSRTIGPRKAANNATAAPAIRSGGEAEMQVIRQKIDEMWKEEQGLLHARLKAWERAMVQTQSAVFMASLIVFALIVVTGVSLWRLALKQRKLAQTEWHMGEVQRAKAERLQQIVAVQREIAGHSLDLDFAMQMMTEHTGRLTQAEGSIVEIVEGDEMVYRAAGGIAASRVGMRLKIMGSLSGMCVREGLVLRCDDSETDDRVDREACRKVGLRSMIVVPLRHQDERLGVLKVMSPRVNAFNDNDVATLELLAAVLSGALSDAIAAEMLQKLNEELVEANTNLELLATTDGMTGLKNHRTFQEILTHEFQRARRYHQPLSLLMLDVDHFKKFNDTFGHPAGDAVLKRVAALIKQRTRVTDHVARYGGEEFVVLLPETDADGARCIADRIREDIAGDDWQLRAVTASLGISTLSSDCESSAQLIAFADQALYQSKHDGRNRVTHYDVVVESGEPVHESVEISRS